MEVIHSSTTPILIKRDASGIQFIEGYAAVWFKRDNPGTQFRLAAGVFERFDRHSFDNVMKSGDKVEAYYNHNPDYVLGDTESGTLHLQTDDVGLRFRIEFDESDPDHQKVAAKVRKGIAKGSSLVALINKTIKREGPYTVRTITNVEKLKEISIVNKPAFAATEAILRSVDDWERTREMIIRAKAL